MAKSGKVTPKANQEHGTAPYVLSVYSSQSSLVLLASGAVEGVAIGVQEVRLVALGKSPQETRFPMNWVTNDVEVATVPEPVVLAYPGYVSMLPTGWTPINVE